jgi:hypothetical protein
VIPAQHSSNLLPILVIAGFVIAVGAVVAATAVIRRRARKAESDA